MALDRAKILFKKFVGGVTSTNNTSPYFNEIAGPVNPNVTLNRLWMLSNRIPATNPLTLGDANGTTYGAGIIEENVDIIQKVDIRLYRIQGTGGATAAYAETVGSVADAPAVDLNTRLFKDIINPFVFGNSYTFDVLNTGGQSINIFSPDNDGYLDFDSGVLSFYGDNNYNDTYIDISAFIYIGPKGDQDGLDMWAKLNSITQTGGGSATVGITQALAKATRVGVLPAPGDAYNGLFYLVNDGNGGTPGNTIKLNVTFDYGTSWYTYRMDASNNFDRVLLVSTTGSTDNDTVIVYEHGNVAFTAPEIPLRNQLFYVQTNEFNLYNDIEVQDTTWTVTDDLYYQYTDNAEFEPKSFEKTLNVEVQQDATLLADGNGHPTGFTLDSRNGGSVDFIEVSQQYNLDTDTAKIINRNSFKVYLNGQKIDIFDDGEQDPVFAGVNPIDAYESFSGAFGNYTAAFPIGIGQEAGAQANWVFVDLNGGNAEIEDFFGVTGPLRIDTEYNLNLYPEDLDFIDVNRDYYDNQYDPTVGNLYPFFYLELTDGSTTWYRKITDYQLAGTSTAWEFQYDGTDLSAESLTEMRLIYFKRPSRITGGEEFFWMADLATYPIEVGDSITLNYLGDIEKSVIVKNNLNNKVTV